MNLANPISIEDHIINNLQKVGLPIVKLIEIIERKRPGTTKQGVYAIIRRLKKHEVVVVHNKNISLSNVWLSKMSEFFEQAGDNTRKTISAGNSFLNLGQGDKLQYYFRDPILTDTFWSHVFIALTDISSPIQPILIYDPHEWFLLARTENETGLFERINKRGQKLAILTGNNTELDKSVRKYLPNPLTMYETLSDLPFPKPNYYINVIAEFVIEVWLDEKINKEIDDFYKQNQVFGDSERLKLETILNQRGRNRFSISHNKRKADDLRRKFKNYFFI